MDLIYPTCCIFLTFLGVLQYSVFAVSICCYFSVLMARERVTYFSKPQISGTHQPVVISARELSTLQVKPARAVLHWHITNTTQMRSLISNCSPSLLTLLPSLLKLSASSGHFLLGGWWPWTGSLALCLPCASRHDDITVCIILRKYAIECNLNKTSFHFFSC